MDGRILPGISAADVRSLHTKALNVADKTTMMSHSPRPTGIETEE